MYVNSQVRVFVVDIWPTPQHQMTKKMQMPFLAHHLTCDIPSTEMEVPFSMLGMAMRAAALEAAGLLSAASSGILRAAPGSGNSTTAASAASTAIAVQQYYRFGLLSSTSSLQVHHDTASVMLQVSQS